MLHLKKVVVHIPNYIISNCFLKLPEISLVDTCKNAIYYSKYIGTVNILVEIVHITII